MYVVHTYMDIFFIMQLVMRPKAGERNKKVGSSFVGCLSTHSFFSSLCITKKRHNCTVIYLGRNNVIIPEAGEGHFSKVLEHDTHFPTVISKCLDYENVAGFVWKSGYV